MPQQRRGGGLGGDSEVGRAISQGFKELRELLERVEGRARDRQGADRGQGQGSARGGIAKGERRPQAGDWTCRGCTFQPNFASRRSCFRCQRPRSPPAGRGGDRDGRPDQRAKGPVGANGSRPMLGQGAAGLGGGKPGASASRGDAAPTYRIPGSSVAARAATQPTAAGNGPQTQGKGTGREPAAAAPAGTGGATATTRGETARPVVTNDDTPTTDDDGFRPVRSRAGWRKARGAAAAASQGVGVATTAAPNGEDKGGGGGDACDEGCGDEEESGAREAEPATPNTLHKAWQEEVAVVRRLKGQGLPPAHPAMRAACDARDSAERAWRGAKDPPPPAVRLARAQARFDRAVEIRDESLRVLAEYQAAHEERLAALHSRLDKDRERVSTRREQLEAVQEEVGAEGQGARARAARDDAAQQVHAALCGTVAPTIAALVEQVDTASPAWTALNGLLATVANSKHVLEQAFTKPRVAQSFNIADKGGDAGTGEAEQWEVDSDWSESHERVDATQGGETASDVRTTPPSTGADGGRDHSMGSDYWWDSPNLGWGEGTRWEERGHGKWTRSDWADSWEEEHGADGTAPIRRRLEPAAASGAVAASAGPVDEAAAAEQRKRQHAERVQRIMVAAIDAGIQPLTASGEELQMLDPHALDAWVAENLPGTVAH